jgi:RNA polymerase sigma factor (sigma-70 family)
MLSAVSTIARNIARRYAPPDVVEDIAQDVLLGFVERLDHGRLTEPPMYLYALVKRLVRRRAIDAIRKRKSRRHREEEYGRQVVGRTHEWMRPDVAVETAELEALEARALEEMSPDSREVFVLVRDGETSYKAAGDLLGLTPLAICGHVVVAQRTFRKLLEEQGIAVTRGAQRPRARKRTTYKRGIDAE